MRQPGLYLTHTRCKADVRGPAQLAGGARCVEVLVTAEQMHDETAERGFLFTEELPGRLQGRAQGERRAKRHPPAGTWRADYVGDGVQIIGLSHRRLAG